MPRKRRQRLQRLMVFSLLLALAGVTALSQASIEAFRSLLRNQAAFTPNDFTTLDKGQLVAKLLPVNDKREVAVLGVVRLNAPLATFLRSIREDVGRQNNEAILQVGKFSSSPRIEDLQELTLEARDIEDLKQCTAGNCRVKLSAAMIDRFHREIDWSAPDYAAQATLLFKRMLVEYVRDYLARGNSALIEYNDRANAVRLGDEQQALLGNAIYFNDFAPEFSSYLKTFPSVSLDGVQDTICWSKIKFGLKPVISITHVSVYERPQGVAPQAVYASKQIYANHYFDSSLALTAFVKNPGDAQASAFLLYSNRARADGLAGPLGGLKRFIVEKQALDGMKSIITETKRSLETGLKWTPGQSDSDLNGSRFRRLSYWFAKHWVLSALAILFILAFLGAAILAVRRRRHVRE